MIKRKIVENKTLYQVNNPSFKEMSLPKIPVNPANTTAACSSKYDFFIKSCLTCPF